jgi:hypothetical protein
MPSPQTEVQLFGASGVDYYGAFSGVLGYFDGYIVVYDPVTYEILSFADLLT